MLCAIFHAANAVVQLQYEPLGSLSLVKAVGAFCIIADACMCDLAAHALR